MDRRFSKTLPRLDLDLTIIDRILTLATELNTVEGGLMFRYFLVWDSSHNLSAEKKSIDEAEEKVIAKMAITFGVLRRLGFSESRVEECLRSIGGIDLEEAYEWVRIILSSQMSRLIFITKALYSLHRRRNRAKT